MKIANLHSAFNSNSLPLFAWASARTSHQYPLPVRLVAMRHNLPLATAATFARLAGIGGGR